MRPIKVGVIGAGYWGPNLIRNFYEIPEAELEIVCDLNPERLNHIRSRFPEIRTTRRYSEVLESDVEAVVIATPVSTHYPIGRDSLRAGKHILIEKPITSSSVEAEELLGIGQELGKVVMAGHTFVYNPAVVAVKEIIASGEIGEVYYINSTRVNLGLYQPDVNVVWDLAPHDISILLCILDMKPEFASARGGMYVRKGVHDVAYLSIFFPNEVMADLRVSWLDPCKIRSITIVGSKKMLVYDDINPFEKVKIYDKGVDVQPYTDTYEEFHLAYRYGEEVVYPVSKEEPLRMECLDFLHSIAEGRRPRSSGETGLEVIQVLEAAQRSLLNGGTKEEIAWQTNLITAG